MFSYTVRSGIDDTYFRNGDMQGTWWTRRYNLAKVFKSYAIAEGVAMRFRRLKAYVQLKQGE